MSILVGKDTRVLVQGLGKTGQFHTDKAIAYGTQMVGGGSSHRGRGPSPTSRVRPITRGCPGVTTPTRSIFRCSPRCPRLWPQTGANASVIYVPPPFAADAIMEAAAAGLDLVVAITEGIPVSRHDRGQEVPDRQADPSHRTQLPGGDHPGGVQDRDHARVYPRAGKSRGRSPARGLLLMRRSIN